MANAGCYKIIARRVIRRLQSQPSRDTLNEQWSRWPASSVASKWEPVGQGDVCCSHLRTLRIEEDLRGGRGEGLLFLFVYFNSQKELCGWNCGAGKHGGWGLSLGADGGDVV